MGNYGYKRLLIINRINMNIRLLGTNILLPISLLNMICIESSSLNIKYLYCENIYIKRPWLNNENLRKMVFFNNVREKL